MTATQSTRFARLAALERWAHVRNRTAATAPARAAATAALDARLLADIDPQRALSIKERERQLVNARRAYFLRLSLRAVEARAAKKMAAPTKGVS